MGVTVQNLSFERWCGRKGDPVQRKNLCKGLCLHGHLRIGEGMLLGIWVGMLITSLCTLLPLMAGTSEP